jgi:ABC-type multidrug transport system permease subunit
VVCPLILAIVALVLASGARRDIAASGGARQGAGLVTAATVIAWINIGISIAFVVLFIIGIAVSSSGSSVSGMLLAVVSWSPH